MARELKPETKVKKIMEAFIQEHGLEERWIEIADEKTEEKFLLVSPKPRWGNPGYIRYIGPDKVIWVAYLNKSNPNKVSTVKISHPNAWLSPKV